MDQKIIREWNNQQYSAEEGAEIFKELDDRTKSAQLGYNSIDELASKMKLVEDASGAGSGLKKDGYDWLKGEGNNSLTDYESGDEIKKVGTLFPGYWVHGYIKNSPMNDPKIDIVIISSAKIT